MALPIQETGGMAALSLVDDQAYQMDNRRLGTALIINNRLFRDTGDDRHGSEVDAANLQDLLEEMGFLVYLEENVTKEKLERVLHEFKSPYVHGHSNSVFLCFMTHGSREGLLCVDNEVKPWDEFTSCLDSVPALVDKPKLILVQACRGGSQDEGQLRTDEGQVQLDEGQVQPDASLVHNSSRAQLPTGADVFIMFPTIQGNVSYRNVNYGSFLIQNLVPVFREKYQSMHLQEMFNIVKRRVAEEGTAEEGRQYKQAAQAVETLRYKFYFTTQSGQSTLAGFQSRQPAQPAQKPPVKASQLPVPEQAVLMKVGCRVSRGRDWRIVDPADKGWEMDGGAGGLGTVIELGSGQHSGKIYVRWDTGVVWRYNNGFAAEFALQLMEIDMDSNTP